MKSRMIYSLIKLNFSSNLMDMLKSWKHFLPELISEEQVKKYFVIPSAVEGTIELIEINDKTIATSWGVIKKDYSIIETLKS